MTCVRKATQYSYLITGHRGALVINGSAKEQNVNVVHNGNHERFVAMTGVGVGNVNESFIRHKSRAEIQIMTFPVLTTTYSGAESMSILS